MATPRRFGSVARGHAWLAVLVLAAVPAAAAGTDDGRAAFDQYCIGCHGPDARGIEGLGVDLVTSAFVARQSPAELATFLGEGRLPDDPQSRTHRPMPAFAWVTQSELESVAAYLKSINKGP